MDDERNETRERERERQREERKNIQTIGYVILES
jgi:hypothetical protein